MKSITLSNVAAEALFVFLREVPAQSIMEAKPEVGVKAVSRIESAKDEIGKKIDGS